MSQNGAETVTIYVDDQPVEARTDETVLPAALRAGIEVPYYCYHPGLPVAANCRMCMVQIETPRGLWLTTACNVQPKEGMKVIHSGEEVEKARQDVMEYLLINHPLDCAICDQAGECALQEYAYRHGRGKGRFDKAWKVHKKTKALGPNVAIWGERCISCTRCVRFTTEVSGTGELCMQNRGDHTVATVAPGVPLDNPLAGNVVDICPVGALLSRDFLHKARVWFMERTATVCGECSKGCSTWVDALHGEPKRIRARVNHQVNGYWMCDVGRAGYRYTVHAERKTTCYTTEAGAGALELDPMDAAAEAADHMRRLRAEKPGSVAGLIALGATNEELFLFRELMGELEAPIGVLERPTEEDQVFPGFTIEGDQNANRAGARLILGGEAVDKGLAQVQAAAESGELELVYIVASQPDFQPTDELLAALKKVPVRVVHDVLAGPLQEGATIFLPGTTLLERSGTLVNSAGRLQPVRRASQLPAGVEPEVRVLQRLLARVRGEEERVYSEEYLYEEVLRPAIEAFSDIELETLEPDGAWLDATKRAEEAEQDTAAYTVQNLPQWMEVNPLAHAKD